MKMSRNQPVARERGLNLDRLEAYNEWTPGRRQVNSRRRSFLFFAFAAVLIHDHWLSADIIVESVLFVERVRPSGEPSNTQGFSQEILPNPHTINFSQTASIPPSFSIGAYDLSWSGDSAHFQSSTDHHLQGFVGGLNSNGSIRFRPAVDSYVTLTGTWTYNHTPTQIGSTVFGMRVSQVGAGFSPWSDQKRGGTEFLLPPSGTLALSGSAVLQAGVLYSVGYNISTDNFSTPPASATWLGNGFIDITVAPVPEPATAAMLLPAISILIYSRRTCSSPSQKTSEPQ